MMNIPRQAPAKMPKKFHLLDIILFPNGKLRRALTAKTCGGMSERNSGMTGWYTHVEALKDEDGEVDFEAVLAIEKQK